MGQWWILSFKWKPQLANGSTELFALTVRIWGNPKFLNRDKECSICLTSLFQHGPLCRLPQFFSPSWIGCIISVRQYLLHHAHMLFLGNGVDKWVRVCYVLQSLLSFILMRQVFKCCWLEESMAVKVFIPRVITHFTHLKFLLHKESL